MNARAVRRSAAGALVACALFATACGDDGSGSATAADETEEASALGEQRVGSVAPFAQCSDWERGTRAERLATIEDIRAHVNLRDGTVRTPELSDEAAYEVLDNTCSQDFASSFKLYKLYSRATGFASFAE